ncbi:peptide chain release factor N(5)-glutamine methyltransferase [Paenibacillus camelliae]|uniref:peptide chain release factor N(5)-glutamine methyltransferase n=1 Tax=Paenibacillus camelliae TaxID=512410 RepID=UPI0020407976|nr:peptide chain release factor N(5)-glutamine methyltransferase [Paenibacillus camelliae]MCM3635278.1 peptide chain release factor N(5)-glutamine methyltransferase [Paenibacillus camelliae]
MTQQPSLIAACQSEGHTIFEKLQLATAFLRDQGVGEAKENAELLLLHVLKLERAQLLLQWQELFPANRLEEWGACLERKGNGEPIQYITSEAWFYGRRFAVSPAVLIPRPETELLVEAVLKRTSQWAEASLHVLDVGTGSGAIAVTLQAERPSWNVIASDLSHDALAQAKLNAKQHGVLDKMSWVQGDLLQPFRTADALKHNENIIDVLISNPPYIPESDMEGLQREVKDYEPHLALVGGKDGLDPYRAMIDTIAELPNKPRLVAFELGIHQPAIVADLLRSLQAWDEVSIITDYAGIDRHVLAIRS